MARTRGWGRHLQGLDRRIAAGLVGFALIASGPAGAEDLSLLVTSSTNLSEAKTAGQSASLQSFTQTLDMNYNRTVSPAFSYRLRLQGTDNEASLSAPSTSTSGSNRFVEPGGDLTLAGSHYSLNVGGRIRETFTSGSQTEPLRLQEDNEFLRLFFTPEHLPAFHVQLERTADTDDRSPRTVDQEATRAIFGANYTLAEKVNLAYTFTNETTDDTVAGRKQDQRTHVGTATYADSFFGDRLAVDGNYLISRLDTTERVTSTAVGGAVVVPVVLSGASSLLERDATVAAVNKIPPDPATYQTQTTSTSTALTFSIPLIVDSGGTLTLNQSIAVGLTPGTSVTTVRLTVSGRAGDTRDIGQQAAGVVLQVFTTTNPLINQAAWTLVPSSATLPTTLNPFFEVSFAATSGNFIKIHIVGDNQQVGTVGPLTATQIAALTPIGGAGASPRVTTGNLLQSFGGGLTARPFEILTLNGNVTYTTNKQDPSGRQDNTGTYSFVAAATPHRLLTATGIYQASFATSNASQTPRTDTRNASLTLSSTPLSTLTTSLSGSRSENETDGVLQNRSDSIGFNTAMKPYRNLNVDFTTSLSQAKDFVVGTKFRQASVALNSNATLSPRLTGLFGYTFSVSDVTGGASPSSTTSHAASLSLTYTLSRFLNATGRWDLTNSAGITTVTQQYRLDVIPTLKTSVFLTYLRTDQLGGATSGSQNNVTLTARWNISRYLDLNATGSFTRGFIGDTVYSLFTTLSFRL
jgi:hypothetical protein